jgi:transcriptional regulator with XRE-family HTH domain
MRSTLVTLRTLRFRRVSRPFPRVNSAPPVPCPVVGRVILGGVTVSVDVATDVQAERIGARIRRLRHARGLTLVQLAESAELSHPFLSQLERGLARPSIGSLEKIARALGSSQLELLSHDDDLDQSPVALVRAGAGASGHYGEGEARMLVTGRRRFHPMEVVGDNRAVGDFFTHAEDEFVHVAAGRVEIDLGAEGVYRLEAGDSLYYAGGTPHRWRARDAAGYRLLVVKEHPARL